jgi:hypothetical protein
MDFIERIFGLAPDGGSGYLELAILLTVVTVPAIFLVVRRRAQRRSRYRDAS